MTAQLAGRLALGHILSQPVAGTPADGNHQPVDYYRLTPRRNDPLVDDPIIGSDLHNVLDAQAPASGLVEASLDLVVPLCMAQLGLFLPHLLNAATPTGTGPYEHVFTSGQRELAGASMVWAEGAEWRRVHTWALQRMEIGIAPESGRRQVTFSGPCSDIDNLASSPLGTVLDALTRALMPAGPGAVVRYGGTVMANLTGGSVTYERSLQPFRPAGRADRTAAEFTPDVGSSFRGTLDLRVKDNAFYEIARAQTPAALSIEYELSANSKLILACPAMRFEPTERPVDGEGLRTESYAFRGEQTDLAPVLTATLTNGVASYPEGA
ncbi:phage tail tube protein [Oceanicaulis alexandrii]|uniref:phage tail tube protein n=1 Tax=Oceanicaulis alexandrii TaxID=153233 RepID=UPI0035CF9005